MQPRKYQQEAIKFSVTALSEKRRAVIQLPTGSGKSIVLLMVAHYWLGLKRPVYIIAPTEEAVIQLRRTACMLGLLPTLDTRQKKAPRFAPLVITTYACAWRRYRKRLANNTLCILDECHHINFKAPVNLRILDSFQAAIGLSATPWSKGCNEYFDKNKHIYTLTQAIVDGVSSEYEIMRWSDPAKGRYQIIYTDDIDYRSHVCAKLSACDYAIYQRKDAQRIITRFRQGVVGTIVVNRMLTEGFDQPQIKRVWIARNAKSCIALMQMAGRALRPHQQSKASIYIMREPVRALLKKAIEKAG